MEKREKKTHARTERRNKESEKKDNNNKRQEKKKENAKKKCGMGSEGCGGNRNCALTKKKHTHAKQTLSCLSLPASFFLCRMLVDKKHLKNTHTHTHTHTKSRKGVERMSSSSLHSFSFQRVLFFFCPPPSNVLFLLLRCFFFFCERTHQNNEEKENQMKK
eukprot:TRINITY_DN4022_c1_g1_i1.p1 TRINITY_DN4022_c1_g1~~TRINITY_DN4022_c1_g1_i1.p1  ORF type:complete len:161 (-),score=20.68 TRINITY_DN4022_c1_g1_i1:240-722(-)